MNKQLESTLPRLASAYQRGLLVPFLGAGMSVDACPSWQTLVEAMAKGANVPTTGLTLSVDGKTASTSDQLIRVANEAVRGLLRVSTGHQLDTLRRAIYQGVSAPIAPAKTRTLAKAWWPLVISTNYDDLFAHAYLAARRPDNDSSLADRYGAQHLAVLGRDEDDCRRVLSSLDVTGRSVLWAIHGFLPRSGDVPVDLEYAPKVSHDIVFGHEEYRRLAHASPQYRRAFAEVYRRRSLLFLGAGLKDMYLLDLFAEVQELYGTGPHPHFAIVRKGEVDSGFLRSRFNINVIEVDEYDHVDQAIADLVNSVHQPRARATGWSYTTKPALGRECTLRISAGELPLPDAGSAVAVSCGMTGEDDRPFLSKRADRSGNSIDTYASTIATNEERRASGEQRDPTRRARAILVKSKYAHTYLGQSEAGVNLPLIALCPWVSQERRDLRLVGKVTTEGFAWANAEHYHTLHMTLLGAGHSRPFAARFALAEIVRAWGRWQRSVERTAQDSLSTLSLHVINEAALFELTSGRMDIVELLTSTDVRFWLEIFNNEGKLVDREPLFRPETETIEKLATSLRLDAGKCIWTVDPAPDIPSRESSASQQRSRITPQSSLQDAGVLPGSTLRVHTQVPT